MGSASKKHCCLDLDHVHALRCQLLGGPYVLLPQRRGEGVVADVHGALRFSDQAEGQMAGAREKTELQDTASTGDPAPTTRTSSTPALVEARKVALKVQQPLNDPHRLERDGPHAVCRDPLAHLERCDLYL